MAELSDTSTGPGRLGGRDSRFIHLDMGQQRERAVDARTLVIPLDALGAEVPPFEALYLAHYRAMREIGRHVTEPGLAVVAVHVPSCALAGRAWVAAKPGQPSALIFGRHSRADLMVEAPGLSLRHLAVILHPPRGWEGVRFAVHDLRTAAAFTDERGRRLEAVVAEGPAFLAAGGYALFALPTGDPSSWPELATDAWEMLPARVHVAERSAEPDRWRRGPHALIGRYPRCEGADLLTDTHVSRAHVLLCRLADRVWAIDVASTAGTASASRPGQRRRVLGLDEGPVVLAEHRATVEWSPAAIRRAGDRSGS